MNTLYRKLSPRKEKTITWSADLFPLDIECHVSGFEDEPDAVFTGYFRRLQNHTCIIFQYGNTKFRLVDLVYLGDITVYIVATGEKWKYFNFGEYRIQ